MPSVVTLTFNPCIDKNIATPKLIPEKKLRCAAPLLTPGGGGINVARVIRRLGSPVSAIYLAGGNTGELLTHLLKEEQVDVVPVPIKNETRENWIIDEKSTGNQYRFIMPGPVVNESELEFCLQRLEAVEDIRFIVVSGSMTEGIPKNIFERIARIANTKNAKLIIDCSGEALVQAVRDGAYLIKPSLSELATLMQAFNLNNDSPTSAGRQLISLGHCDVVIISLGAGGALLITDKMEKEIPAPPVVKKSTTGAGDSLVAGVVHSLMQGENLEAAVQFGVACGSAATTHAGTAVFSREEVCFLNEKMREKTIQKPATFPDRYQVTT
jgi:6-phosphofructokinase 2